MYSDTLLALPKGQRLGVHASSVPVSRRQPLGVSAAPAVPAAFRSLSRQVLTVGDVEVVEGHVVL